MKHRITVLPNKKTIMAEQGDLLMTVLAENGYSIATPCGGNGTCGKCKVWVVSDTETEEPFTNGSYLYACKTYIDRDLTIVANEQIGKGLDRFIEKKVEGEQSGFGVALDDHACCLSC